MQAERGGLSPQKGRLTMKEIRKLDSDDLRQLCINKDWYTRGNNEEYSKLLKAVHFTDNVTTKTIVTIAQDILSHSDTVYSLESICFEIAEICHSFFDCR